MAISPVTGLAICAGVGAIELGLRLAIGPAYRTVGVVEQEARLASVWVARMDAALMDRAAIWDDLTTFDGRPWRGTVDIISGGIPCQPFSVAGQRGGIDDERWLWSDVARITDEIQPRCVFIENVPGIVHAGLPAILSDLAALGFDAEWGTLSASDVGAPHVRNRFWLLAYTRRGGAGWLQHIARTGWQSPDDGASCEGVADASSNGHTRQRIRSLCGERYTPVRAKGTGVVDRPDSAMADTNRNRRTPEGEYSQWLFPPGPNDPDGWADYIAAGGPEPVVLGGNHGDAEQLDRIHAAGNGVVPLVAATAFIRLAERIVR